MAMTDTIRKMKRISVTLSGLTPIMFDRYPGDNKTSLRWVDKVYLVPDTRLIALPTSNIHSFLSAENTISAPKRLRGKAANSICRACLSFVVIEGAPDCPQYAIFSRQGDRLELGENIEELGRDPLSGLYLDERVARLPKGIPNPQKRPVLPTPWELSFYLKILPNNEIKEIEIRNLLVEGGLAIGLGTFRGMFGKFEVSEWSED